MKPEARLPLQGVRVLDLSYVFAVPYIGALMADLGADVIKVEGPHRLDLTRVHVGAAGDRPERAQASVDHEYAAGADA